jgi:hypothetical protein
LHFTLCHVTTIFIGTRRTVMWWCILTNQTCKCRKFGWKWYAPLCSHQKWISKMRFTCLILHSITHFLNTTAYFSENLDTSLQEWFHWHLLFQYTHHLLMNIYSWFKQQMFFHITISDSFMGVKWISLDILLITTSHIIPSTLCHTKPIYEYKIIFSSGN